MSLKDNPIFLTQKRLVDRGGILAAILIAALVGLSLLSGLIGYLARPEDFTTFESPQDAGRTFYGWIIGVEILVLIIGSFTRITRVLGEERKAGLWDSNRLTPLKPRQLIIGYWFGPPLREFYMSAILAAIGLVIVLLAKLSVSFWLGTQILVLSTALFFGLLAVLTGLVLQKPQGGIGIVVVLFFSQVFCFAMPKVFLTAFLLPIYGIVNLFMSAVDTGQGWQGDPAWTGLPQIFGFPVYPILLTLGLQMLIGLFLWRIVVRKTANPFQPALLRWEGVALFAIMLLFQHGLIWGQWNGAFPHNNSGNENGMPLLPFVHGGTLLLALIFLSFASPLPESIRVNAARLGIKSPCGVFTRSSVFLAFALTAIVAVTLLAQFVFSFGDSRKIYLIAVGNVLAFCLVFSLLFEFCRLRYKRRALGFVALWLFVLCVMPFIFAGVFGEVDLLKFSLLSPGCAALADPTDENLNCLLGIVAGHLGIAVLLFFGWQREWKKLLARTA